MIILADNSSAICLLLQLNCMYQKVELRNANKILLKDKFHQIFEEDVVQNKKPMKVVKREAAAGGIEDFERNLHFVNKKIKYVWNPNVQVSLNIPTP